MSGIVGLSMELTDPMIDAVLDQEETVRQLQVTLAHAQEQLEALKKLQVAAKVLGSRAIDLHVDVCICTGHRRQSNSDSLRTGGVRDSCNG